MTSKKLYQYLKMLHGFNSVSMGLAVVMGYIITLISHQLVLDVGTLLAATFSAVFITSAGFVINDIEDIEIDRINRPDRPLAAGDISTRTAWWTYHLFNVLGMVLAFLVNPITGVLALVMVVVLYAYSRYLKRRFLVGHATVGMLGALVLPFGAIAADHLFPVLYIAPVAFAAFFAREILKTVPDYEGDKANGVDNIATRYSPQAALRLAKIILSALVLVLPLLTFVWALNQWFNIIVLILIWPVTFFALYKATSHNVKAPLMVSKLLLLMVSASLVVGTLPV